MTRSPWVVVAPPGAGFSVEMPGQPTVEDKGRTLRVIPASQSAVYQVQIVTLADIPADPASVLQQLLRTSARGWQPFECDDCVAIDCSVSDKNVFRVAFFKGRMVYVLMVVAMTPATYDSDDTDRFFGSLRFVSSPKRVQIERLSVELPNGWTLERNESTVAFVSPDRFRVGPIEKPDRFTVTVLRTSAKTAAELGDKLTRNTQSLDEVNREAGFGDGGIVNLDPGRMKALDVAGTAAVVTDGPSTIEVHGLAFTYIGPKVFLVVGDLGYVVAARFSREREATVGPIAKAFVESLRVEGD